ncbi:MULTISPECIES: acyl-CoA dehydrogenase family protein [Desulfitobacterium]|uniref:Acyl-CoA dehydrogenase n=1 Tax=Desulfitobacterium dehalogenans (strain ATCC 51507 / DSM 9161 / JW/IU-DC1) TaxID=756499 RepID=I4AB60_DESDJ|nr:MULTISPECIES: acyl-CoA dehydrogenase family protein [Desulfitobacterium]AFM01195.1 acyl-CoA dehydrogenase [Desulfitobacterium dehalogenans ATCC 51507]
MFDFLLTPGQKLLQEEAARFVKEKVPKQLILDMDEEKVTYPKEYLMDLGQAKLLGLRFAEQYSGRGLQWVDEVSVLEEIGVLGTSLACLYSLPSIVGEAINHFGSEVLKNRYLKPTLEGKLYTAEALTEPRGGSDFFGATTLARREGDFYILNGQKRFVVGAEGADYFMVYAKTDPEGPAHQSISAFIVDRGPGVEVEHIYGLMGTRGGGAGRVVFKDVKVPAENLLGVENGAADIFYQMMIPERLTSAAGALGMARAALEVASDYSTKRKAFGRKIKDFQGVNFKVADSITRLDAARALVYATARAVDSGVPGNVARRLVSEAKKFATDSAWAVVNDAMQIMGGIGYTNIFPIERLLRDIRLIMIWTGTNEVMNLIIQHEYYKERRENLQPHRSLEEDAVNAHLTEEKVYE